MRRNSTALPSRWRAILLDERIAQNAAGMNDRRIAIALFAAAFVPYVSGVCEIAVQPGAYWTRVVPPAGYSYSGAAPRDTLLTFTPGQTAGMTVLLSKQ